MPRTLPARYPPGPWPAQMRADMVAAFFDFENTAELVAAVKRGEAPLPSAIRKRGTPVGRAMAGLLAIFAEFEREILRERTRAGLAHARQNGKRLGRPVTAAVHAARDPETAPRRHQQIRDRPPVADRPYLGSPDFGLTYFSEK